MKVKFETRDEQHSTFVEPHDATMGPDGVRHVWLRTKNGQIKRADMV